MGTATMLNAGRNYLIPENTRGRPCGLGQTAPMSLGGERIALCYEILFHVLGVTGIDYRDGVTIDGISIIPLIGIGHVITFLLPSRQSRFSPQ